MKKNGNPYLSDEEQEIRVFIIERHDDTSGVIEILGEDRGRHVLGVPDHEFTRSTTSETDGGDLVVLSEPQGTSSLNTDVGVSFLGDGLLTRINDTNLLVLGVGAKKRTVVVPVKRLDDVGVTSGGELSSSALNIPDLDVIVLTSCRNKVFDDRVELNNTNLTLVSLQSLDILALSC